ETGPGAPGRRYDGDRLVIRGNTRYAYDALGQMVTKVQTLDDGAERTWSYEWNLKQQLAAVVRPDGMRVEFAYDPFSRRTVKRVFVLDPLTRAPQMMRATRYLWHLDQLVLERQFEPLEDGTERETVTSYFYGDSMASPLAQQRTVFQGSTETKGPWLFLVGGQSDAPEELVDGGGVVHAHIDRTAYGVMTHRPGAKERTTVGFLGQFFDEETGLFYNRERYYDPEIGRFINHDPVGTQSGSNVYHYTPNPIGYCDPLGLKKHPLAVSVQYPPPAPGAKPPKPVEKSFESGRDSPEGKKWSVGTSQWGTHTEPQAMKWLQQEQKSGKNLKGATVKMEGASPPCVQCSKKMRRFANKTGATIEYTYPNNKTVKYAPGAKQSPEPVAKDGKVDPGVKNLCHNYNEHHDHTVGKNVGTKDGKGVVGPKTDKPNYETPPQPSKNAQLTNAEKERQQTAVDQDRKDLVDERNKRRE
ncbi:MAG TPA: RHS repeat-associated core domain-containing protein, partial [Polyangiaceae bacterium]|nr:RHS repeat-associated core domain-containing protein [Polyangiaceae bacterium]